MASDARPLSSAVRPHTISPSQQAHPHRKLSKHLQYPPRMTTDEHDGHIHSSSMLDLEQSVDSTVEKDNKNIGISAASKAASYTVAPFLAEHIPEQYNPVGGKQSPALNVADRETKFCYRHRPDLKCRRQANEPSMELLQKNLSELSKSDQQGIAHVWSLFSAAPAKQRDLMLKGILAQCCFPQLSMISDSINELIKIDFLYALPTELAFQILCYLDTASLCNAAQVSRHWRGLADDDVIWHRMCEQHIDRKCTKCGWGLPMLDRKRLRMEKRSMQLRAKARGLNEWSPAVSPAPLSPPGSRESSAGPELGTKRRLDEDSLQVPLPAKRLCADSRARSDTPDSIAKQKASTRPWKDVYKARFKVGSNWKHGRCTTRIFKGHANGVMCLQVDDNILATGSYDATVKIWNINTGECLRTLHGHTSGIRTLQFDPDGETLMSGSLDSTIKIWNWKTGELKRSLAGHTDGVITLSFAGQTLVSGGVDRTIRVWDFKTGEQYVLHGHTDWVNQVKLDPASRTVLSASDDCTVRLWDLDRRRCIRIFEGHVGQVQQVVAMPPEFEIDENDLRSIDGHDTDTEQDDASSSSDLGRRPSLLHRTSVSFASGNSHSVEHPCSSSQPQNTIITPLFPGSDVYDPARPSPPRYMLTGGLDSTIRCWDIASGRCLWTAFGHLEGIWALAADGLRLVSGAEDRMVKVWEPTTGKWERNYLGHNGPVTCLGLSDSKLVTGSEDCEIRVMEFGCQDEIRTRT